MNEEFEVTEDEESEEEDNDFSKVDEVSDDEAADLSHDTARTKKKQDKNTTKVISGLKTEGPSKNWS